MSQVLPNNRHEDRGENPAPVRQAVGLLRAGLMEFPGFLLPESKTAWVPLTGLFRTPSHTSTEKAYEKRMDAFSPNLASFLPFLSHGCELSWMCEFLV